MQKQEGQRMICPECKANGIDIEIVCKKIVFQGEERLSWRNPDSSAHFNPEEDQFGKVTFVHTPTVLTSEEIWKSEIEDRLARVERQLGIMWSGE